MGKPTSIFKRRERIKRLGEELAFKTLESDDRKFLSEALIAIGNGEDPNIALDIKGRVGESKGSKAQEAADRKLAAQVTMQARRDRGESLEYVVSQLGENGLFLFGLTEETLRTYAQEKIFPHKDRNT